MSNPLSTDDISMELSRALRLWRSIAVKELELSVPPRVGGLGIGEVREGLGISSRPFFTKVFGSDNLTSIMRSVIKSLGRFGEGIKYLATYTSGYELGRRLVTSGIIRSLDDLPIAFVANGVGLVDVVKESLNRMVINIYECLSCYASKPVGKTMCWFEAGALRGVLESLYKNNKVKEKECWGLGYSFCSFIVEFE